MSVQRRASSAPLPLEPIFARHAGPIPLAYLRALAYRESGLRPAAVHPKSSATGLFQITTPALKGYNASKGTKLTRAHLLDPETNTRVAVHHLGVVMGRYGRHRALKTDWSSRRWVELLTLGWNAGHNALAGLAAKMEASGMPAERITVDTVSELARTTGRANARYVAEPARVTWAKSVASLFLGGGAMPPVASAPLVASVASGGGGSVALVVGVVMAAALGIAKWHKGGPAPGARHGRL